MSHCVEWREKLRPALKCWEGVMMLTLTVNPKKFDGPQQAYELIQRKRSVSELMKKLENRRWVMSRRFVVVIEFHQNKAHRGWPHWHLLVESRFVPKHGLQKLWRHGNCWFSKADFVDASHAVNYVTKYITKTSEDEDDEFWFPDWVLDFKGNFRRFSTSRGLVPSKKKGRSVSKGGSRIRRTGRQRAEDCWQRTNVFRVVEHVEPDGELLTYRKCCGTLREPWHKVSDEEPIELERRLQVQKWNDRQVSATRPFDGLDPEVFFARQQWRKQKAELRFSRKA